MKYYSLFLISLFLCVNAFPQNTNLSNGLIFDGEPYIAVNPNNSQHIVVAWMGFVPLQKISIKTKTSFNGGQTWSNATVIPHAYTNYTSADPSLDFDSFGNVFLCYIDSDKYNDTGAVYIRKSIDGGITWGSEVVVIETDDDPGKYPVDRPWMVIDRSGGITDGNVYITTMNPKLFGQILPPYHAYITKSTDGGNTFSAYKYLDTTLWLVGNLIPQAMPTPAVTSSGILFAIYPSYVISQNVLPQYILAKSLNAATTFSYSTAFASSITFSDTLAKKGYLLRSNPANPNHISFFFLWTLHGDADVFFIESTNGGNSWSSPKRINDDSIGNNRMQDLVWADFDLDGDLIVSWRDRRNASDSTYLTSSEIWAAVRHKDSINFSPNFKLSDNIVSYDSVLAESGNDFMCVKIMNDTIHAVWGDTRTGKLNIWYQRLSVKGQLLSSLLLSSEDVPFVNIFPNPSTSSINIISTGIYSFAIYDDSGKLIESKKGNNLANTFVIDIANYPRGNYILSAETERGIISKKFIKE